LRELDGYCRYVARYSLLGIHGKARQDRDFDDMITTAVVGIIGVGVPSDGVDQR
jgi:hypothetical protein